MFSDDGKDWNKQEMMTITFKEDEEAKGEQDGTKGNDQHKFDKPIQARYGRMLWAKTDGSNGIHAQFLGFQVKCLQYIFSPIFYIIFICVYIHCTVTNGKR